MIFKREKTLLVAITNMNIIFDHDFVRKTKFKIYKFRCYSLANLLPCKSINYRLSSTHRSFKEIRQYPIVPICINNFACTQSSTFYYLML